MTTHRLRRQVACVVAGLLATTMLNPAMAQLCQRDTTPISFSSANFIPGTDDTIAMQFGNATGQLIWKRCAVGQTWDAVKEKCKGIPLKKTWKQALQLAASEGNGWRLPNVNELAAIVDYQCFVPPIDLKIFPNTPESNTAGFWTSTPYQHVVTTTNTTEAVHAWYFRLSDGALEHRPINDSAELNFIKLVRSN